MSLADCDGGVLVGPMGQFEGKPLFSMGIALEVGGE